MLRRWQPRFRVHQVTHSCCKALCTRSAPIHLKRGHRKPFNMTIPPKKMGRSMRFMASVSCNINRWEPRTWNCQEKLYDLARQELEMKVDASQEAYRAGLPGLQHIPK